MKLLWQQIPSPMVTDILCNCKSFDGVVLDTEHSMFNPETIMNCIMVCTNKNKQCYVRVHPKDNMVSKYLDCGIDGLIFSTVEKSYQGESLIDVCKYPPVGSRGQGLVRENMWGRDSLGVNKVKLVAQLETVTAIDNIADIARCNSFDYYMIGPYDLSASLGCRGDFKCDTYTKAIKEIETNIHKNKIGYHIVSNIEEQYSLYKDYGFLAISMDTMYLKRYIDDMEELLGK